MKDYQKNQHPQELNGSYDDYKTPAFPVPSACTSSVSTGHHPVSNGMRRIHKILSKEEIEQGKSTKWMELEISGTVRFLSEELWVFRHLTALFVNGNQLVRLPPEIAQLQCLQILDLSYNKLRSLPAELGDLTSLLHLYLNYNQLRVLPYEIGKLFRLQTLGLHGNPLTPEISRLYNDQNGTTKLIQYMLDRLSFNTEPLPPRPWISLHHLAHQNHIPKFTVLCYNVLCDKYASSQMYSYCPSWALEWAYRKTKIMDDLKLYDADVLTLQEIETGEFQQFFKPQLTQRGYTGIFSPKSRAKTMSEEDRRYVDGCAIFWKTNKFSLEKEHLLEFTQLAIDKGGGSEHMLNRVMTRDNIALCAVLRFTSEDQQFDHVRNEPLVVATAHIHWDPEFCDVKLVQTMMLVHELQRLLEHTASTWSEYSSATSAAASMYSLPKSSPLASAEHVPFILCGDLNSLPDSGVFEYLCAGRVPSDHPDFKEFRRETCLQALNDSTDPNFYTHRLRIESAYNSDIMPFTNYTFDFRGMIDYILSGRKRMIKLGVLGPHPTEWFTQNKILGCPHPLIPSDHFPLMAQFAIIPR